MRDTELEIRDKMGQSETLPPKHLQAIEALLVSPTVTEAAEQVGVSRRTLHRWMRRDVFQRALQEARDATVGAVAAAMTDLAETAVVTLEAAMTDPDSPPSVKVRAAMGVLAQLQSFIEFANKTQIGIEWELRPQTEVDRLLDSMLD